MPSKKLLISLIFVYSAVCVRAQVCTTLGQTPVTAFPVCGNDTFVQKSVPVCINNSIPTPCPVNGNNYQDQNPFWYKFTCFKSGTLGLTIQPNNLTDDYDWQIFDITGHNPGDVYTNSSLFVACNWSGLKGITGTSATATSISECGSTSFNPTGPPIFSKMPQLLQGHNYLLLISHFLGDSQSGYNLSFNGGTASITDTLPPALVSAAISCDDTRITLKLNKKMKCSSLASDGSDFSLSPSPVSIISATGNSCSISFDMDSLTLVLSAPLSIGNYSVIARNGSDGNTVLDNCDAQVPIASAVPLAIIPIAPTPMDSLTLPGCAANTLQLVFSKRIQCGSIAPDGSDFVVTGSSPVTVSSAVGVCGSDGLSASILVKLSGPIVSGGSYRITLRTGTDGNTITDECSQETPAGSSLNFNMKDTVSAAFSDQVLLGCVRDTIEFSYPSKNGVDQWRWLFDGTDSSNLQNPEKLYTVFNNKTVQLIVSNGFCSDTAKTGIVLDNAINASFEAPNILCPKDLANFINNSTGNINSWSWQFGDGTGSSSQTPSDHLFPPTGIEKVYPVMLVVGNELGCSDTAVQPVDVLRSCYIAVPSAFTPNGDGVNDYLYPLNAYNADNLDFRVYNRYGQLVFESKEYNAKWDGKVGGQAQPAGSFVWTLQYTDRDTKKKYFLKGVSLLVR